MTISREIGKISQCEECGQKKTIHRVVFFEKRGWTKLCSECFKPDFINKYLEEIREIVFKPEEICLKHNKPKKLWKKGESGKFESHCYICDHEEWLNSLQPLNHNSLQIAKFFYNKGVDNWSMIQKLVYFSFIKSLEQKKILFNERFTEWEGNPILNSLYEKSKKGIYPLLPATVLKDIEELNDPLIRDILIDVYQNLEKYEEEKRIADAIIAGIVDEPTSFKEKVINLENFYPRQIQEKRDYILSHAS